MIHRLAGDIIFMATMFNTMKSTSATCPPDIPADFCGGYRGECRSAGAGGKPTTLKLKVAQATERNVTCSCRIYYTGSRCEMVDWKMTVRRSIGSTVFIEWPQSNPTGNTPLLRNNYAFIYYRIDPLSQKLETDYSLSRSTELSGRFTRQAYEMRFKDIDMVDNSNALMIDNLIVGGAVYRICLEQKWRATRILELGDRGLLTNCVITVTSLDYNSLGGWMVIVGIIVTIFVLIFIQRDRIKLVYFSKQPPVVFVAPPEEVDRRSIIPI